MDKNELGETSSSNGDSELITGKPEQSSIIAANNDHSFIKEAVRGNHLAWEQLHAKYFRAIKSYIQARCFHSGDINDLEQEAWLEIYKHLSTYESAKGTFYSYAKYWIKIILHRYWREQGKILESEVEMETASAKEFLITEHADNCWEFLSLTFSDGGPPHQILAFSFNRLISAYAGKPQKIVDELSDIPFSQLCDILIQSYSEESMLKHYELATYFKPLIETMDKTLENILDAKSKQIFMDVLEEKTGNTTMRHFYKKDPEHCISDWTNRVILRIRKLLLKDI